MAEVHILASSALSPKQVVRNIESALLAHLGLKVDHRKISVAQTADVKPLEAMERGAVREQVLRRSVLFEELGVATARSHRGHCWCDADGWRTDGARGRIGGRYAPGPAGRRGAGDGGGAGKADGEYTLVVEGVKVVEALDRTVVFAVIRGMGGRDSHVMTGTAKVRESAERAAVFAVLDATNRWVEARRSA